MPNEPTLMDSADLMAPIAGGLASGALARLRDLFGSTARRAGWALADQATVSATNFATTVLIGRLAGPAELGLYSMAFSALVWILAVQETLITLPYTVFANRVDAEGRGRYAGSALLHGASVALLALVGLAAVALVMGLRPEWKRFQGIVLVLAFIVPFALLRDFIRRVLFAHLELSSAARLDMAVSGIQLTGLAGLVYWGGLSAANVCAVMGMACALAGGAVMFLQRRQFEPRLHEVLPAVRTSWDFGRWGFGSRVLGNINSDITMVWVVGGLLGSQATGVFAACAAIVAFSNPFMLGSAHFLTPKICRDFGEQDQSERRRMVAWVTLIMGLVLACFCLAVWLFGGQLMEILYGRRYGGHHTTLTVLALSVLATALSVGTGNALFAMDRPDLNFRATMLGMFVGLLAVAALALPFGLTGVAGGLLCGHLVDSGARAVMFLALTRDAQPATVVSADLTRDDAGSGERILARPGRPRP